MKPALLLLLAALPARGSEFAPRSPEESRATFVLPPGYIAECIASEPMVQEPVLAVWDGDGGMYVAEMRSYMQDENGTGTKTLRNGRIKRLTDENGDGIMDRATVFADNLNLPRMILPLDDRIAVAETDSTAVWSYRDRDGDGVAEEKHLLFKGKPGDPNKSVEHQPSGLDWNLDNWIYVSYGRERYRFTDGTWRAEPTVGVWSQWGVTHDDAGRVFFSENATPAMGFNLPRHYWSLIRKRGGDRARDGEAVSPGQPWETSFLTAKNIAPRDDRGGKASSRKTFTSIAGQSIYRGSALPAELRGDYFFCDPTIHVVRRAKIEDRRGRLHFTNPHGQDEFLLSSDLLFRPVHTASGPDGCLTVVDMYRGIIQDAPWLNPGARKFLKDSGLAAVTQRGRIWRIRHQDSKLPAAPRMLSEATTELVRHLTSKDGWWRDTAQRLIILRPDHLAARPALETLLRDAADPLARLHALWTLEGIDRARPDLLRRTWSDPDPRVRAAAIRIAEGPLAGKQPGLLDELIALADGERDPEVAKQLVLTLGTTGDPRILPAVDRLTERFLEHAGVMIATTVVCWQNPTPYLERIRSGDAFTAIADPARRAETAALWTKALAQWDRSLQLPADMPPDHRALVTKGEDIYFQSCVSCHGPDGMGTGVPGSGELLAPPLAGSSRVRGPAEGLVPALLHGLVGPIDGRSYQGAMMVPASALGIVRDDRLAELVSYIRHAWGNEAGPVSAADVTRLRKQHAARTTPWTDEELKALLQIGRE